MSKTKDLVNELLVDVFNHILSIEERTLKDKGIKLSMSEVHVLEAIKNVQTSTMSNVAQKLKITVGTLTTAIHTLVRKGYVIRKKGLNDKRVVFLELTTLAEDVLVIHESFHNEMIEAIFKDLNIEEDEVLIKSLEKVTEYFKDKY